MNVQNLGHKFYTFSVAYTDDKDFDRGTLGNGEVKVTGPNGFSTVPTQLQVVERIGAKGTVYYVTYQMTPPGGFWATTGNGKYTIALQADTIADMAGNKAPAADLGTFTVNVGDPPIVDTTAPTAKIVTAANVDQNDVGALVYQFTVRYTDDFAVNVATLGKGEVSVTGPNGFNVTADLAGLDGFTNGTPRVATYNIIVPGGWSAANKGTYTISLAGGKVADEARNTAAAADLGTFTVDIGAPAPADTAAPTALLNDAPNIAAANAVGNTYTFKITYTDNDAVKLASLTTGNVTVTGPNGFVGTVVDALADTNTDGTPRTMTYSITVPGGAWTAANNGTYTIGIVGAQVSDVAGNKMAAQNLGTFTVDVNAGPAPDTAPPTATIAAALGVNNAGRGETEYTFTIEYADNTTVQLASIADGNLLVQGPNGFNQIAKLKETDRQANGTPIKATYTVAVPGGWTDASNGTYTILLESNQIKDLAGNAAAQGAVGTFVVNLAAAGAADVTPPTAKGGLTPPISKAYLNLPTYEFTIEYQDDISGIDTATLGADDLAIVGPFGFQAQVTYVKFELQPGGKSVVATYNFGSPSPNGFQVADNGDFAISVVAGSVLDKAGNPIEQSKIVVVVADLGAESDKTAPTAKIAEANTVTAADAGKNEYQFSVTYTDDKLVDANTLGNSNIRVTGPNGFSQDAVFVLAVPGPGNAPQLTVTYQITPPGGTWRAFDNGTYSVTLQKDEVFDTAGNGVTPGPIGSFIVALGVAPPAGAGPTAAIGTLQNVGAADRGKTTFEFTVDYTDPVAIKLASLGNTNVYVKGPNGFVAAAEFVKASSTADAPTIRATYRFTPPTGAWSAAGNGSYSVDLDRNQVFAGNGDAVPARVLGTFAVNVAGAVAKQYAVGADAGGGTVRFFNPDGSERFAVTPFPGITGGVRTAAADFNNDGVADVVVGTGPGRATQVVVIDGATQVQLFSVAPFEAAFTGGVYVAAGDLDGDGKAELVVTPDQGGGPRVQIYNGNGFTKLADFFGIDDPKFRGGARAAIGDFNGDGKADLTVAAGFGGGPRITIWNNADVLAGNIPKTTPLLNRYVFEEALRNGAFITLGDINGDGFDDIISGGGPGGGPRISILDSRSLLLNNQDVVLGNFFGGVTSSRGGIRVSAKDLNNDGKADIVVGAGAGSGSRVTAYSGAAIQPTGTPPELYAFDAFSGFTGGVFVG